MSPWASQATFQILSFWATTFVSRSSRSLIHLSFLVLLGAIFFNPSLVAVILLFSLSIVSDAAVQRTIRQMSGKSATKARRIQKCCLRSASLSTFILHLFKLGIPIYPFALASYSDRETMNQ